MRNEGHCALFRHDTRTVRRTWESRPPHRRLTHALKSLDLFLAIGLATMPCGWMDNVS